MASPREKKEGDRERSQDDEKTQRRKKRETKIFELGDLSIHVFELVGMGKVIGRKLAGFVLRAWERELDGLHLVFFGREVPSRVESSKGPP